MIATTIPARDRMTGLPLSSAVAGIVERHRRAWLADAAAYLRVLDWTWLAGRQLVILDFEDVPHPPPKRSIACTSPLGLFELVAPYVKPSGLQPGPVMFISAAMVARANAGGGALDRVAEVEATRIIRVAINAVAIHEYAHAVDYEARGRKLPAGITLETIFASPPTPAQGRRGHSAGWVRAYAHLVYRSMATPAHRDHYLDAFRFDVEHQGHGPADDYLDALDGEVDHHGIDLPLVDVLRTPAPAGFTTMFDARDAARSATEET